jgi:alpha-2-macroglobulin-like protein
MSPSVKKLFRVAAIGAATLSLAAWITPQRYFNLLQDNDFLLQLKKKVSAYNETLPEDRVYLHLDKPFYEPGDDIWFSAYVRDGQTLKPSGKSDIVHIELVNPRGGVERKISVIAKNGQAAGDFALDKEVVGGLYKIRAYTNWMKNEGEEHVFERSLQVQDVVLPNLKMKLEFEKKAFGAGDEVIAKLVLNTNENKPLADHKIKFVANLDGQKLLEKAEITDEEGVKYIKFRLPKDLKTKDGLLNVMIDYNGNSESVSRSIPIVLNKISFNVFPEGGDLVSGLQSNIAFRALNESGKPADVEGVVLTEKGSQVASFSSYHMGMGSFAFIPQPGEKYKVKITRPEGINETFELPAALGRGYVLSIDNSRSGEIEANIKTTETEELSLVAQERGKIYYATAVNAKKGNNKIVFSTKDFPAGVAQVTVFDSKGIERAERLVFVNKEKQLNVSIETDKEKYLPREKVKLTISVKDERGLPMPANLSLSVVNDQLLSFANDKSGTILSQLLLEQDLGDKVEEPAFYFDRKEEKADKALDYLLMTSGWRRFTWEKMLEGEIPSIAYTAEKAILAGQVIDAYTGKPLINASVKVPGGAEVSTNVLGKFTLKRVDLSNPVALTYKAPGYSAQSQYVYDYNENLYVYMYPVQYYTPQYNKHSRKKSRSAAGKWGAGMPAAEIALAEDAPMGLPGAVNMPDFEDVPVKMASKAAEQKPAVASKQVRELKKLEEKEKSVASQSMLKDIDDENSIAQKVGDLRDEKFNRRNEADNKKNVANFGGKKYYRARQYAAPVYKTDENVETRTDFRTTIYWNPEVEVGHSGKKTLEFFTSDDITSFRVTAEGLGTDGSVGRSEKNFFTQLPFAMTTKVPVEVATEDIVSIPLTLQNNTKGPLGGALTIAAPEAFRELVKVPLVQTVMPGAAKTIYLDYKVLDKIGYGEFTITFRACGLGDAFTQKIKIAPKGFPVTASFAGQEAEKEFSFTMNKVVNGSVKAIFTAYPSVVSDLMKGVEGILREPGGCFEQTSMSAWPNAMVLDYLKATDSKDDKTLSYANALLDRGYKRLTTFETSTKGYEWFGQSPAHEGLTAYGIMEFTDMKKAGGEVDQKMIDRTADWLLSHKDGKGGFARKAGGYHAFGSISDDVTNAYIVYALAEAGYTNLKTEFAASARRAQETKDAYLLAMMANAAMKLGETKKGEELMSQLLDMQAKDGSWTGSTHSITYSQGQSLTIETTSIMIQALIKENGKHAGALNSAVQYLTNARSGYGVFGSTQGTVLALKALTEYAKFSRKASEDGTIVIYVDGRKAAEKAYKAGDKGAITVEGLEKFISAEGKHDIKVKYLGVKNPLPYSVAVSWNTSLPGSNKECAVGLQTEYAARTVSVGETVRLKATVSNKKDEEIPSAMAIVGIPAGFTVQPWQLKELQEKQVFDYYEILGNNIAIYYRGMGPKAVKEINLDLKAEMPGEYDAPASSAYLYYTNEYKTWCGADKLIIKKNG